MLHRRRRVLAVVSREPRLATFARKLNIFVVLVLSGSGLVVSGIVPPTRDEVRTKIGAGVSETLRLRGAVDVVIALVRPNATKTSFVDLDVIRREVADLQQGVLDDLDPFEYRPKRRFRTIPALAGRIGTPDGLARIADHPSVLRVDLDVGGKGALSTTVPLIGADRLRAHGVTGKNVVIAVLDSGLDTDHVDLRDDLLREECFLDFDGSIDGEGLCPDGTDRQSGSGSAEDDAGHGTHVAGIITSSGLQSAVGVAPDASIVALKVTAGPSFAGVFAFFSEVVAALDYIIDHPDLGVQIVNVSLGSNTRFDGDCDSLTAYNFAASAAVDTLRANGVVTFAAAGNNGSVTSMTSPACLRNVISVGASDRSDAIAEFSNRDASTDLFAPGVAVASSGLGGGTTTASGTSMAAPHAAGCAALLIQSGESRTPDEIEARLKASVVRIFDRDGGRGIPRVDCGTDAPSMLVIDSVAVTATAFGVQVRWTTLAEDATVEFRVLKRGSVRRTSTAEIVGNPIPASGSISTGATYRVLDPEGSSAAAETYFVEDVDRLGRSTRHGPFFVEGTLSGENRRTHGRGIR